MSGAPVGPAGVVGVVVAARDAERWVGQALRSLQAQTLRTWHCVVVDDGSSDGTADAVAALAREDPRIHLVRQAGSGVSAARNTGVAHLPAGCELVAFLDSDDLYEPGALQLLADALAARPDAVGAYGLAEYVDEAGALVAQGAHPAVQRDRRELRGRLRMASPPPSQDLAFAGLVVASPVWPAAVALHRRAPLERAGGFDTSFPVLEDWELLLRMARSGPYVALDRPVARYRRHDANLTRRWDDLQVAAARLRRAAWLSPENTAEQRLLLARAWRYLELRQARELALGAARGLRARRWAQGARAASGALLVTARLLRPGPPSVRPKVVRWTRPRSPDAF